MLLTNVFYTKQIMDKPPNKNKTLMDMFHSRNENVYSMSFLLNTDRAYCVYECTVFTKYSWTILWYLFLTNSVENHENKLKIAITWKESKFLVNFNTRLGILVEVNHQLGFENDKTTDKLIQGD